MSWLDRQSFLGADSEAMLAALKVGIIGLGGGGSHVAQQLAHVGVGNIVVVDDDVISDHNLNRLVGGTRDDVRHARPKVEIAERVIRGVNPDAKVTARRARWQGVQDELRTCDVIFGCVDNVQSKHELETFCRRLLIPYIDQGMDVHELAPGEFLVSGQVVLSIGGGPCLRCFGVVTDDALAEEARNYGAAGGKPQVVWPNGVLASTGVGLFMKMVTPWHRARAAGTCMEYDGNRHTIIESDYVKRLAGVGCPHHKINNLGDPGFDVRRVLAARDEGDATAPLARQTVWWRVCKSLRWLLGKGS